MFSKQAIEKEDPPSIIPRLQEITNELMRDPMTKTFKTLNGKDSIVRSLMARNVIGVVDASIPEGEIFPEHIHENPIIEYMIIYQGRITVMNRSSGETSEKGPGGIFVISDEERHVVEAMSGYGNARVVVITIPREPSFPGDLEE